MGQSRGLAPLEERAGFSAKESLFKALFPLLGRYFGFEAAIVNPDLQAACFDISLVSPLGPFPAGQCWRGQVAVEEGCLLTALLVP